MYLNFYRVILASIFLFTFIIRDNSTILGHHAPALFLAVTLGYLIIGMFSVLVIRFRLSSYNNLVYLLTFTDIGVLSVLMHASGGIASGLGMLLVVAIAAGSIITEGRTATLFAAMAAISVLAEQFIVQLEDDFVSNYTQAGFLGGTLFATAILAHILSSRLHETEALALQRGIDLANMAQLNEHVIRHLQSGLIVVDQQGIIRMMNESAWESLGRPDLSSNQQDQLQQVCNPLNQQLKQWQSGSLAAPTTIQLEQSNKNLLPGYQNLGVDGNSGTLIFLEDASRVAQQAQQMKLASLGRLTASIAHEVRNPLGAISHAEQLLSESPKLDDSDRRLTEIIHKNSERVNAIIENVLQLSRRGNATPESIELLPWVKNFVQEFQLCHKLESNDVSIHIEPKSSTVFIDPTQMQQVIWNLCENGLRYSIGFEHKPLLKLEGGCTEQHCYLEVIDQGPGIDNETANSIFEPFFTTEKNGSGLGLYISKELCEVNSARLSYRPNLNGGSCFRIDFPSIQLIKASA